MSTLALQGLMRNPVSKSIVLRGLAAMGLCILISLAYGSVVVGGPVLYGLGFAFYGGLGYIALGLAAFFVIALRDSLIEFRVAPRYSFLPIGLSLVLAAVFVRAVVFLNADPVLIELNRVLLGILLHLLFWLVFALIAYGLFGGAFIRAFVAAFRKPLLFCLGAGVVLYASMPLVWRAWPVLSFGVSRLVYGLATVFPGDALLTPPLSLRVQNFGVIIGESCSGVFSIFLFSALFALLIALDVRKIIPWRAAVLFVLAMVGLFLVNVLRVYLIVLVGALYDPALAVGLFHSYVGTVLFLLFFVAFVWYCAPWMQKPVPVVTEVSTLAAETMTIRTIVPRTRKKAKKVKSSK